MQASKRFIISNHLIFLNCIYIICRNKIILRPHFKIETKCLSTESSDVSHQCETGETECTLAIKPSKWKTRFTPKTSLGLLLDSDS